MQQEFEELNEKYGNLLEGNLSIDEFWKTLFPFVMSLLNNQDFKDRIGEVNLNSLNYIFIKLRDKKKSYNEYKDMGDKQQARLSENSFISISAEIIGKLEQFISKLDTSNTLLPTVVERYKDIDTLNETKTMFQLKSFKENIFAVFIAMDKYNKNCQSDLVIDDIIKLRENWQISYLSTFFNNDVTYLRLLKILSNAFRNNQNNSWIFFYFFGYVLIDLYNELYISSYEIDDEDPFIGGFNFSILKDLIIASQNKNSKIVFFLDCLCVNKHISYNELKEKIDLLFKDFNNSDNILIILSIELYFKNDMDEEKCYKQGVFTKLFLDSPINVDSNELGIITLSNFYIYIKSKLHDKYLTFIFPFDSLSNNFEINLFLAKDYKKKFNQEMDIIYKLCEEIESDISNTGKTQIPKIYYMIRELKGIQEKILYEKESIEMLQKYVSIIDSEILSSVKKKIIDWLEDSRIKFEYSIENKTLLKYNDLINLTSSLMYERLTTISNKELKMLDLLSRVAQGNIDEHNFLNTLIKEIKEDPKIGSFNKPPNIKDRLNELKNSSGNRG